MKLLYPEIEPYQHFFLAVGSGHSIYVELSGNADGIPVVFLHGGPCSGTRADHRRFFNPQAYQIILFDQRGCGQSLPFGALHNNTTQDLIDDMEKIRIRLGIQQWLLFGGSWGATLALLYAQQHRTQVTAMIIRGLFLARQQDHDWFLANGVNNIYPECWQQSMGMLPTSGQGVVAASWDALWSDHASTRYAAANAWQVWGGQVALGIAYQDDNQATSTTEKQVLQARMEIHYARAKYFIEENQILDNSSVLHKIPTIIIHGRYDLVCPIASSYQLKQQLDQAEFWVLPTAGHVAKDEEMVDALVAATVKMANTLA